RIRERSPLEVGCASRMDLAEATRLLAVRGTIVALTDFVLDFGETASASTSGGSSSSASTITFLGALAPTLSWDFSVAGTTLLATAFSVDAGLMSPTLNGCSE